MNYRKDIDGLRALAVLPVLFYHAGSSLFSGGYVGVDIFFVISGFLITTVILQELEQDRFTISNFYVRRIRRIFPALFFVVAVTTLICLLIQMPYDLRNYGKSLAATVFFGSNIYFRRQMGYFDSAAETKPLLHTWSLSVEEQFYIFYPIILILIARYLNRAYLKYIMGGLFTLSFLVSLIMMRIDPSDAFYFIHTRAWELLLGALLALGIMPKPRSLAVMNIAGIIGLIMILVSVVGYTNQTAFPPGISALLPCFGAFFCSYIQGFLRLILKKLLSMKPLVFIGLISYSLYLWHWPLLTFFNEYKDIINISEHTKTLVTYSLLLISFIFATVTYKLVETPFRKYKPENVKVFFLSDVCGHGHFFCLSGSILYWTKGFPSRLPESVHSIDHGHDEMQKRGSCKDHRTARLTYDTIQRIGDKGGGEPEFILFGGDSHAGGAIAPGGFDTYAKANGHAGLLVAYNGLVPLYGMGGHERKDCHSDIVQKVMDIVYKHDNIKKVVLVARWVIHVEGGRKGKKR